MVAILLSNIAAINVQAKENFNRTSGTSYVATRTTIVFKSGETKVLTSPCENGYGSFFEQQAAKEIGILLEVSQNFSLSRFCRENDIPYFANKSEGHKYRDVVAFGKN